MVVKGDGSLVRAEWAMQRPIETILSGPAASAVGAWHLARLARARPRMTARSGRSTSAAPPPTSPPCATAGRASTPKAPRSAAGGRWSRRSTSTPSGLGGDSHVRLTADRRLVIGPAAGGAAQPAGQPASRGRGRAAPPGPAAPSREEVAAQFLTAPPAAQAARMPRSSPAAAAGARAGLAVVAGARVTLRGAAAAPHRAAGRRAPGAARRLYPDRRAARPGPAATVGRESGPAGGRRCWRPRRRCDRGRAVPGSGRRACRAGQPRALVTKALSDEATCPTGSRSRPRPSCCGGPWTTDSGASWTTP